MAGLQPGYFAFYVGTAPEKLEQVEAEIRLEASFLRREGLSREELSRAKAKLIGQKKISRQDLGTRATASALDEIYGLGYNHAEKEDQLFEAVTLEQIRDTASKYLVEELATTAILRPNEESGSP